MFVLDNGDKIRGDASVAAVIDYTVHGLAGDTLSQLADGQLADSTGDLYTAGAIIVVTGMVLVNIHSAAVTVNLFLLPSGGTARRILAKDFTLGVGYSLHYDGAKVYVLSPTGAIVSSYVAHAASHVNSEDDIQNATAAQKGLATAAQITKLDAIEAAADVTDAVNVASSIHGVAGKATPVDADEVGLVDSAAANVLKVLTWANIKATLKAYFDTLYNKYVHPNHSGDVTSVADGAQTIANKQTLSATTPITVSNTPTVIAGTAPVIALPAATNAAAGHATAAHIQAVEANTAAKHTQGTDTALGTQAENLNMGNFIITALKGSLNTAEAELTIATGVITATQMRHKVDTEADAASDDLVTINGGTTVNMIVLRAEADARTVVVKHGTGNIWLQGKADISLDDLEDGILLFWDSTNSKWFDIGGGGGGGSVSDVAYDKTSWNGVTGVAPSKNAVRDKIESLPINDYVKVSDVKAYTADGGTFTLGAWRTRDINTEDSDASAICSIASNQITLEAGTYVCSIKAPFMNTAYTSVRLYNITDSAVELTGQSCWSSASNGYIVVNSIIVGKFTIAAQKTFEIQHQSDATNADNGFGLKSNMLGIDSVYTIAEFWRVAT